MTNSLFPHPSGMESFWRSQVGELDQHRTTPELPAQCDILIIGAGYSAAALVTHLLSGSTSSSESIVIVEARQLCSGATGRNGRYLSLLERNGRIPRPSVNEYMIADRNLEFLGGHLKPDSYNTISRYAEQYGLDKASEVANFEFANVKAVTEYIERENIDCDLILTRAIDVQLGDGVHKRVKRNYDTMRRSGLESAKETFAIPDKYAERVSGVKNAKSAYSYTAGHLWPYKLIHHMFATAIAKGVNLQTETVVTRVSSTHDKDGYWSVHTNRTTILAKRIIFTTNAYTGAILPEYKEKIIPYRAICCRIICPGQAPVLSNTYALRFNDWDFDYLIPRPDGSIIVGGARGAYLNHIQDWYNNVDDSQLIDRAKSYFDGYMQRHFIGWEDSGAKVSETWTGIMGYSADRLPRVGHVPDRPGMFIMAGFTGHGMPQIFLTAKGIASMVRDNTPFNETGIPSLFQESKSRLSALRNEVKQLGRDAQLPRARL